jgi:hypothetical protein
MKLYQVWHFLPAILSVSSSHNPHKKEGFSSAGKKTYGENAIIKGPQSVSTNPFPDDKCK